MVGRDKLLAVSSRDACTIMVKCQSALTLALNTVFFAVNDRATTEVANASCLLLRWHQGAFELSPVTSLDKQK